MNGFYKNFCEQKFKEAEEIIKRLQGQPAQTLNEADSFAIAFAIGEEIDFVRSENNSGTYTVTWKTRNPMTVFWNGKSVEIHMRTDSA